MRTVATIYWDRYNGNHHTIVCDVEENGGHSVLSSAVRINTGKTLEDVIAFWTKAFGEENVRAYTINEYVPNATRYRML